jgi:hypothetical protein
LDFDRNAFDKMKKNLIGILSENHAARIIGNRSQVVKSNENLDYMPETEGGRGERLGEGGRGEE